MLKKGLIGVCLFIALGVAFMLAKVEPSNTSHAGNNEVTFYSLHLDQPNEKEKIETVLHNLIGIDEAAYHPEKDSVTVTFEYDQMRKEWIAKALESAGIPFSLKP